MKAEESPEARRTGKATGNRLMTNVHSANAMPPAPSSGHHSSMGSTTPKARNTTVTTTLFTDRWTVWIGWRELSGSPSLKMRPRPGDDAYAEGEQHRAQREPLDHPRQETQQHEGKADEQENVIGGDDIFPFPVSQDRNRRAS